MDKKTLIGWLVRIVAHGLAWVFAAKLGMDAAQADADAATAAEAIGALVLVGWSIYDSMKHRKSLQATIPPVKGLVK